MPISRYVITIVVCGILGTNAVASRINVSALEIESNASTITAKNGVLVTYGTSLMRADRATYDKTKHRLALDGHVAVVGYQNSKEQASRVDIDTRTDEVVFQELFYSNANDIWVLTHYADRKDGNYTFGPSILSSCDVNDPIWKIRFLSSHYDSIARYMKLYHATVYMWGIPVLYTPYLAFATDNGRQSGLLFPRFGYSVREGFVYEQPIYWAISDSMDLEIDPQIRTLRSIGGYATYRFVDSAVSQGKVRVGYFKDKAEYVAKNDLSEDKHYGVQFVYDRHSVFSYGAKDGYRDGLYIDITWLNDIDYLNLQKNGGFGAFGQSPLQQSILNYYTKNHQWYSGVNAKYFIDTRLADNNETVQILPSLQLHRFVDALVSKHLTYSLDVQTRNLYRKEGMTLRQMELRFPIEWTMSWFDDYISLSLSEQLHAREYWFDNGTQRVYDNFRYVSAVHGIKLFSDLTARLGSYIHVVQPSISYLIPGGESSDPVDWDTLKQEQPEVTELFNVGLPEKEVAVAFNQYLYDQHMHLVFFHRLKERYFPNRQYALSDLENEMAYQWKQWKIYSNLIYSFEHGAISESSSFIAYQTKPLSLRIGHTYKQNLQQNNDTIANDIQFRFRYTFNDRYKIHGQWSYDIEESGVDRWMVGGSYQRDCWSIDARVGADIRPQPVTTGGTVQPVQEYTFFVQLSFKPFVSINTSSLGDVRQ